MDEALPEQLFEPCIDILKETTSDERELINIGIEIIHELRDSPCSVNANSVSATQSTNRYSPFQAPVSLST